MVDIPVGLELGYGFNSLGGYFYFIITSSSGGFLFLFFQKYLVLK